MVTEASAIQLKLSKPASMLTPSVITVVSLEDARLQAKPTAARASVQQRSQPWSGQHKFFVRTSTHVISALALDQSTREQPVTNGRKGSERVYLGKGALTKTGICGIVCGTLPSSAIVARLGLRDVGRS